jgi:biopolymer transport protein ExbD
MKLETTLEERPGFLHALPVVDLFALLLLFFLLGPSLVLQSGIPVELPPSRFQMERYRETLVVTLGPGEAGPRIHLGRDAVTPDQLAARLEELHSAGHAARAVVLVRTDAGTAVGDERAVVELILEKGFRVAMVGRSGPAATRPNRPDEEE